MPALGKLNKQYLSVYNNKYTGDELFIIGDPVKGKSQPALEITLGDNTKDWVYADHLDFIPTLLKYEEEIVLPLTEIDKEKVNHPSHYGGEDNPYEAIKVIEAWNLNFNLGNTVKYIARAGKKDELLVELKKAAWYLDREIKKLENV